MKENDIGTNIPTWACAFVYTKALNLDKCSSLGVILDAKIKKWVTKNDATNTMTQDRKGMKNFHTQSNQAYLEDDSILEICGPNQLDLIPNGECNMLYTLEVLYALGLCNSILFVHELF